MHTIYLESCVPFMPMLLYNNIYAMSTNWKTYKQVEVFFYRQLFNMVHRQSKDKCISHDDLLYDHPKLPIAFCFYICSFYIRDTDRWWNQYGNIQILVKYTIFAYLVRPTFPVPWDTIAQWNILYSANKNYLTPVNNSRRLV